MNQDLADGTTNKSTSKKGLLGLPRSLAGAFIGVLVFLLILLPINLLQEKSLLLSFISLDLEFVGRMSIGILGMFTKSSMPTSTYNILSATISAIPPAILGALIGSSRKWIRISGIVLLVVYIVVLLVIGTMLILIAI